MILRLISTTLVGIGRAIEAVYEAAAPVFLAWALDVEAAEREAVAAAVLAEREACAKAAQEHYAARDEDALELAGRAIAYVIRARSNQ